MKNELSEMMLNSHSSSVSQKSCLLLILLIFNTAVYCQNSFQWTGGPYNGAANVIVTNSAGHVFAGCATGVYRSTDNGGTWTWSTQALGTIQITSIAVSSEGYIFSGTADGKLYRSQDNGSTWSIIDDGLPQTSITSIIFAGSGVMFVGSESGGVSRSTNNGNNWTPSNQGLTNLSISTLAIQANGDIYAGTDTSGIFKSTNNGAVWSKFSTLGRAAVRRISFNAKGMMFVLIENRLLSSSDNGTSWKNLSWGYTVVVNPRGGSADTITISIIFPTTFVIDPNGTLIAGEKGFATGSPSFLRVASLSTDDGVTWKSMIVDSKSGLTTLGTLSWYADFSDDKMRTGMISSVALGTNGSIFFGSAYGGIIRYSTNDSTWKKVNTSIASNAISSLVTTASGKIFALNAAGAFAGTPTLNSWKKLNTLFLNSNDHSIAVHPNGDIVIAYDMLYRSTDEGETWGTINSALSNMTVAVRADGTILTGSYLKQMVRSSDGGITWNTVSSIACSTLVNTAAGNIMGYGSTFISIPSKDSTNLWISKSNPPSNSNPFYTVHTVTMGKDNFVYAGTNDGVYRSTNYGDAWTYIGNGLPINKAGYYTTDISSGFLIPHQTLPDVKSIVFDSKGALYVSCTDGIYSSTNSGDTWAKYISGITGILTMDKNNHLLVGTADGGVYTTLQPTVGVRTEIPLQFALEQNYPNPFNPSTTISFSIPGVSFATLTVFDVLGREVATIARGEMSAGYHSFQWSANALSTGIYFYRLQSGTFTETKKMMLLQ